MALDQNFKMYPSLPKCWANRLTDKLADSALQRAASMAKNLNHCILIHFQLK